MHDQLSSGVVASMAALEAAGFPIHYVDRSDVLPSGHVSPHPLYRAAATGDAYADLGSVGRDECDYGQSSTVDRSNYRSLMRDYPDAFTPIAYSNVNALGAFVADLPDDLVKILTGLRDQYAIYDESDLSELESDEITETWEEYVRCDITWELRDTPAEDHWLELSDDAQRDLFWQVVSDLDIYPEHDGHDVRWSEHYGPISVEIGKRLSEGNAR